MVTLEITVSKILSLNHRKPMTRVPKACCREFHSVAELDGGESDLHHDRSESQAHESSCQTALSMSEMQVVSSLAQVVHCERHDHAPHLIMRGGGSPHTYEKPTLAATKNQLYANIPGVTKVQRSVSPPKMPKAKWNSDVRCSWPPRSGSGERRKVVDSKFKDAGVMTFPAINAGDLIKKVEALELELDVHVGNERQLLSVNEQLRQRLEECLHELSDAGVMNIQLDNLNHEMEKILRLLRHLSERNAVLEKEKAQVQAKLQREATGNKLKASKMLRGGCEDHDVDVCDAECQTICSCQQVATWCISLNPSAVDTRKRRRERKRWLKEEEKSSSSQPRSKSLSPTQMRNSEVFVPQSPNPEVAFS